MANTPSLLRQLSLSSNGGTPEYRRGASENSDAALVACVEKMYIKKKGTVYVSNWRGRGGGVQRTAHYCGE